MTDLPQDLRDLITRYRQLKEQSYAERDMRKSQPRDPNEGTSHTNQQLLRTAEKITEYCERIGIRYADMLTLLSS
jgi:hypothetical protein